MFTGLGVERVNQGIDFFANQPRGSNRARRIVRDYESDNFSEKVLRIVPSYTNFVNRRIRAKANVYSS